MGMSLQMDTVDADDSYALMRDYKASSRLLGQHHLWKMELGYLIHPSIPVPAQPRIADVATGNGCWLLDVASNLPEPYNLHGFDISLDQVPVTTQDPTSFSTIRFHTWDIFKDPPKPFVGAFDILHTRLITVVFRENEQVIPIIENLKKLLKPGGYLQWEEVDNTGFHVIPNAKGTPSPAMEEALVQLCSSGKGEWKQHGARFLNENCFFNAQQFHIEPSENLGRHWTDIYLACWAEYVEQVLGNPEKAKKMGDQAMREARRGAVIVIPVWIWIAQKAPNMPKIPDDIPNGLRGSSTISRPSSRNGLPNNHSNHASFVSNTQFLQDPRNPVRGISVNSSVPGVTTPSERSPLSPYPNGSYTNGSQLTHSVTNLDRSPISSHLNGIALSSDAQNRSPRSPGPQPHHNSPPHSFIDHGLPTANGMNGYRDNPPHGISYRNDETDARSIGNNKQGSLHRSKFYRSLKKLVV
ncbi:hypothetical protein CB0940_08190 [Cercospora beticola]|uniref:Uncharacterized protein n=1 Tax=Cercospora beticola TaxID=122368 RepID=A0A2G5HQH8_CERBT|nr:hypothetical protein CB0940_08190 [Cercospora beticola]PIA94796.1 hypothetical protein CB0940_08190 [Cercospora beticola]WPB04758.1 hypothetical protein RHO25_009405 [Cercospora beticola]